MAENVVGVITNIEDDSYDNKDFKKVTLDTGQVLKVKQGREGALKAKWDLLQVNRVIKFIMKDYTKPDGVKVPFVNDIEAVETPPPQKPQLSPQDQEEVNKARAEVKPPITGQEIGMWWKQLGDDLRSGHIDKSTPEGKLLRMAYFAQMFRVLGIKLEKEGG